MVNMNGSYGTNNFIVRLRGLPWNTTQAEVKNFLQGSIIDLILVYESKSFASFYCLGCKIRQINFVTNEQSRIGGECFVVLESNDDFDMAKTFNQKSLGNRTYRQ